jgi:hypothetical protein
MSMLSASIRGLDARNRNCSRSEDRREGEP